MFKKMNGIKKYLSEMSAQSWRMSFRTKVTIVLTLCLAVTFGILTGVIIDLEKERYLAQSREKASGILQEFAKSVYGQWNPALSAKENGQALNALNLKTRLFQDPGIVYAAFQNTEGKVQYIPKCLSGLHWMLGRTDLNFLTRRSLKITGSAVRSFASYPEGKVTELLTMVRSRDNTPLGIVRLGVQEAKVLGAMGGVMGKVFWRFLPVNILATTAGCLLIFFLASRMESPLRGLHSRAQKLLGKSEKFREQHNVLTLLSHEFEGIEKMVKSLKKDRTQFVSTLSHEFRSPLQAILGYADFMRKGWAGPITEDMKGCLDIVKDCTERFRDTISNLLDLVRLEGEHLPVSVGPMNVKEVVEEAVKSFQAKAKENNIRLFQDVPSGMGKALGDPVRVFQVLTNLLSNAYKFTPERGFIKVSVKKNGSHIEFFVQDTGPGIPAEFHAQIFDEFFHVPEYRPLRGSVGVGIGLTLCKRLMAVQKGEICLEKVNGTGTTVRFILPAEQIKSFSLAA